MGNFTHPLEGHFAEVIVDPKVIFPLGLILYYLILLYLIYENYLQSTDSVMLF